MLKINQLAVRPEPLEGRMANYDTVSVGGSYFLTQLGYQSHTPAKEWLEEFWRLEKEAEKMLKGLGP